MHAYTYTHALQPTAHPRPTYPTGALASRPPATHRASVAGTPQSAPAGSPPDSKGKAPSQAAQTKARALFQGLLTLAQFAQTPATVIAQLGSVWEAWTNPNKRIRDLAHGHPEETYAGITPLYISKNQSTPDAPANEQHLRQRQRDAALAAWERTPSTTNTRKHGSALWITTKRRSTPMLQPPREDL